MFHPPGDQEAKAAAIVVKSDDTQTAIDKLSEGKKPAVGEAGKKGELEGEGGDAGGIQDYEVVDGEGEKSYKNGEVRAKKLSDGGYIETHKSTQSPGYKPGTRTVEIRDPDQKVVRTVRYPGGGQ